LYVEEDETAEYVNTCRLSWTESCLVTVQHIGNTHLSLVSLALTANHVFFVEVVAKTLHDTFTARDAARRPRRPLRHCTVLVHRLTFILNTCTLSP